MCRGAVVSLDNLFSHRGPAPGENHHARTLPAPSAAAAAAATAAAAAAAAAATGLSGAGPADPRPGPVTGTDQGCGQADTGEHLLETLISRVMTPHCVVSFRVCSAQPAIVCMCEVCVCGL